MSRTITTWVVVAVVTIGCGTEDEKVALWEGAKADQENAKDVTALYTFWFINPDFLGHKINITLKQNRFNVVEFSRQSDETAPYTYSASTNQGAPEVRAGSEGDHACKDSFYVSLKDCGVNEASLMSAPALPSEGIFSDSGRLRFVIDMRRVPYMDTLSVMFARQDTQGPVEY